MTFPVPHPEVGRARAANLAAHLRTLAPESWNYCSIVAAFDEVKGCGTCGCAAGYLPHVDPENWTWTRIGRFHSAGHTIYLKDSDYDPDDVVDMLADYFGMTKDEVATVFFKAQNRVYPETNMSSVKPVHVAALLSHWADHWSLEGVEVDYDTGKVRAGCVRSAVSAGSCDIVPVT